MEKLTDQQEARAAVDRAIAGLTRLRDNIGTTSCINTTWQAESAVEYIGHTYVAHRVGVDLTVALAGIALRCRDGLDDVLFDAKDWASERLGESADVTFAKFDEPADFTNKQAREG